MKINCSYEIIYNTKDAYILKVFILPRVAELFIHKEKQKVVLCLVQIDIHTYISAIYVYIYYLFV